MTDETAAPTPHPEDQHGFVRDLVPPSRPGGAAHYGAICLCEWTFTDRSGKPIGFTSERDARRLVDDHIERQQPARPVSQGTEDSPEVVCICGSMRFRDLMLQVAADETSAGRIVLMPFAVVAPVDQGSDFKAMLDTLHRRKIDMADRVIVVMDESGYYGESTSGEIEYASKLGKVVSFQTVERPSANRASADDEAGFDRTAAHSESAADRADEAAQVERMAKAMHAADYQRGWIGESRWEDVAEQQRGDYVVLARAAFAALTR